MEPLDQALELIGERMGHVDAALKIEGNQRVEVVLGLFGELKFHTARVLA